MEGKGLLFKIFADIDVFDIEIDATDTDKFVDTVKLCPNFWWNQFRGYKISGVF